MAYYIPQINPALQNWYGQFYQPIQPPLQNPVPQAMPQQMQPSPMSGANQPQQAPAGPAPVQGGFVRVQSEQEARAYPVAPGNSVTFIDENAPFCYVKAVDASALDRPRFEKYRLVKEEDRPVDEAHQEAPQYALMDDVEALSRRLSNLEKKMKKEVVKDEPSGE